MNGFDLFCTYQAVKLHFNSDQYDYFKYNGKTSTREAGFEARKDKYSFHKLARELSSKEESVGYFVANFLHNSKMWTTELLDADSHQRYVEWRKTYESLSYQFDQDMKKIMANLDDPKHIFTIPTTGDYPLILIMLNQKDIKLETIAVLHGLTGFLNLWDKHYSEDYIYQKTSALIKKYQPFLHIDTDKFRSIVKKHLTVG